MVKRILINEYTIFSIHRSANEHKLWWKVPYVNNGSGTLSATVQVDTAENAGDQEQDQPLTTSSIVNAYFVSENALFSSIDFDLISRGYRISLLKKKILSGKFSKVCKTI
jgi:hypothetical protein